MLKKFYVFGNIGKMSEVPKSGGQSSARRVIHGLEAMGYEMEPIIRRRCVLEGKLIHFLETQTFAIIDLFKIIKHIMFGNRKTSGFLMLTYGGDLAPYELIISICVRVLGYKSVTYMKGGQFMDYYKHGSRIYRWLVKTNMDLQSQAWFEGMPSLNIVKEISDTHLVYYPNYVLEENIVESVEERPKDRVNLIYFGRVTPEKNIDVILKAFDILCKKYDNMYLTIIGGPGFSRSYVEEIDNSIKSSKCSEHITRKGLTPFVEIKKIMQSQHYFVFPSRERAEGHSNSLTEAMAQGVVPIVSDYHFNRDIVGDDRLVVDGYSPEAYAEKIEMLWNTCNFNNLSVKMRNRIRDNFSRKIVNDRIAENLEKL